MSAGLMMVREPVQQRRRWGAPPGLRGVDGPFEGWGVLAEVDGAAGLGLWQALRDAELWAGADPDRRDGLWQPDPPTDQAAGEWAAELREMTAAHRAGPEERARACLGLSRAAAQRGCFRTASGFAEAAARILPLDAGTALEAGRALRRTDGRRAEAWVRRAAALARRARDRSTYGLACCAWGALLRDRGEHEAAWDRYLLAARMARRYGLWRVRPLACWGLCAIAAAAGRTEEATLHGRRAMRSLGRRDPRLPLLAHDLARAWAAAGYHAAALRVLRPAAEKLRGSTERASVITTMAMVSATPPSRVTTPRHIDALSVDLADTLAAGDQEW